MPYHLPMRLLSLDYDPTYGPNSTRASLTSDISVFDYDVVIWDPRNGLGEYTAQYSFPYPQTYRGVPSLGEDASVRIVADADRHRKEFAEFIAMGRVLITIVRPPRRCYIDTGKKEHSGTGRNRKTTVIVKEFDLLSALPVADCQFSKSSGRNIELKGTGPIVNLLRKYRDSFKYAAVMANPPGEILAYVGGTKRVVSSIQRSPAGGYLVLLPAVDWRLPYDEQEDYPEDEEDQWLPEAELFQADLLAAIEQLAGSHGVTWPSWAEQYVTDDQQSIRGEIIQQQEDVEAARNRLADLQQEKEVIDSKNQLFLGSGRGLELEVKKVLELLGGAVTDPKPGRDDWKVSFPEGNAVVEVKGVTKSAAEKHAAQLEKWVAGEFEETGIAPKGILVVNTWRDIPLEDRTEPSFPDQMVPYCESRQHCLISSLQLFVIRAEVEKEPARADHWRTAVLSTAGKVEGCDDWRSAIRVVTSTKSEN